MNHKDRFRLVRPTPKSREHKPEAAFNALIQRKIPESMLDFLESAKHFELDAGLETVINTALAVGAPLLLTGDPGTGKTQVAWYLGWYFGIEVYDFQVKSTSTAIDLKYDFDAVAYLRDAQAGETAKEGRHEYLDKKALWLAYDDPRPSVLLIDEIDKAPRDFPNDLLQELDKHCFQDPFSKRMIEPASGQPPIVIITSNAERRLPDAFLRRCIYHRLELDKELIQRTVRNRVDDFPHLFEDAQAEAQRRFWEIQENFPHLQRKPATGELLVWLAVLSAQGVDAATLKERPLYDLPGLAALIKDEEDRKQLRT